MGCVVSGSGEKNNAFLIGHARVGESECNFKTFWDTCGHRS